MCVPPEEWMTLRLVHKKQTEKRNVSRVKEKENNTATTSDHLVQVDPTDIKSATLLMIPIKCVNPANVRLMCLPQCIVK